MTAHTGCAAEKHMDFTPSQQKAILCRGSSVLVSAGAGSGKTRVLTERLMEYLDPQESGAFPEEISSFLIITFTRAAAGELRGRIASAITARLQEQPENGHLRRQLALSRNAKICTIHTFCADLLRENASLAGISPAFRILEEERAERLRTAALERVLERCYEEGEKDFLQLADTVGAGRNDSRLSEQILKLHDGIQSHEEPLDWIRSQAALLQTSSADFAATLWGGELMQEGKKTVSFWADEMERCLAAMGQAEKIRAAYGASFEETALELRHLCAAFDDGWDAVRNCLPIPFPRISGIKNNPDPILSEQLKSRRDACKKAMEKLQKVFDQTSESELMNLNSTAPSMSALLNLAEKLENEFQDAKRRINGLDFNDLEHRALKLLRTSDGKPTELAKSVASRYTEIMVDEYQDVSRVQDALFSAVSREGRNLFFVGDMKQSIYRFRLADPTIFTEKTAAFSCADAPGRLIRLQENFRSRPEVLQAVNSMFECCMSNELGDLNYGPEDCLISGASYPGEGLRPELMILKRSEDAPDALEAEAEAVALRIIRLMRETKISENGEERPLRYSDIAILLRAANTVGGNFRRVLMKRGIPVAAGTADDFYGSVEVSTVFAMLSVMDNPHQDIPLLTLLRSPSFRMTPDQISMIRAVNRDGDFYSALCLSEDPGAVSFLNQLKQLRQEAPDRNPADLMERVIEALELYALCSAMPDGERRARRLAALLNMAETFRHGDERGLHRFVIWLRNMQRRGLDPGTGSDGSDCVQILSIHKSKGLEFPVVFCSGLGRSFNRQDTRATVLVHPELGLGPRVTDPVRKLEFPTAARHAIESRLSRESLSEEMRLLYVAMTRAREQLILTACVRKPEEMQEEAAMLVLPLNPTLTTGRNKIPAAFLRTAASPLQWVLAAQAVKRCFQIASAEKETGEKFGEGAGSSAAAFPPGEERKKRELIELLHHNLEWAYPHEAAEGLPSKVTPTELKGIREADMDAATIAPAVEGKEQIQLPVLGQNILSAVRRGSTVHQVMQHIDFRKTGNTDSVQEEISRLTEQEFITEDEARGVEPGMIVRFFSSELGQRMMHAEHCWREFRFSLMNDADGLFPEAPSGEKILLQGVVDCCFEEDGQMVLLDYKTDRVDSEEALRQRTEAYRIQLDTYASALERIFRLSVKEKILYFLRSGEEVHLAD